MLVLAQRPRTLSVSPWQNHCTRIIGELVPLLFRPWKSICSKPIWLVVSNILYFPFHIWDNPSHWLIFFKMVKATNQPSIRLFKNNQDYLWSSTKIHGIHFMSLMYIKDKVCRPFYPSNHRQNLMLKPWFLSMNFWKRHQNDPTYLKLYLLLCIFI